ncbi:hypothetical protein LMH87_000448 [Akanthomyces muscarius]|uniref:Phospholipid methyltransferase n=1 Tax=Akanthomyces muscarius TaxID=2231603 RepID=A0A9W8QG72_AKAMU|nr:hypothetical protein LMH87_000448 [Akanthomyces muscarius]KAJ4155191.1 hypothetical protein LMH87_000448 [Akanthomyces muscarius]
MVFESFQTHLESLIEPWLMIALSVALIPYTTIQLILSGSSHTIFSPSDFSDALFARVWVIVGPIARSRAQKLVVPLLEGRISGGKAHDEVVSVPLHGTVLEVGAGTGEWADVLARIHAQGDTEPVTRNGLRSRKHSAGGVTRIYGVEPNAHSAALLQKRVDEVGLSDVYEVAPVGIESVTDPSAWDGIIERGSVDCIVSIRCMCSIPAPEKNIKLLYELLKPGGSWYVFEHVQATRGAPFVPLYQRFVNYIWMWLMGSCRICRPTEQTLRQVGPWKKFDLNVSPDEPVCAILPHVVGVLTK